MSDGFTREVGIVEAVFAHRFVFRRMDGTRLLADLGPEGAKAFRLVEGAKLSIEGSAKPSELKVFRVTAEGGEPILIAHDEKNDPAGADAALRAVAEHGLAPVGRPRRKPKHFEVLARRGDSLVEIHVALDGHLRGEKPADEKKWSATLVAA